jgi:hypothetical protein
MWERRRLATLLASTACYRDSIIFLRFIFYLQGEHIFLYITGLQITKKPLLQYVTTGQCRLYTGADHRGRAT